jgi:hypothetical protein
MACYNEMVRVLWLSMVVLALVACGRRSEIASLQTANQMLGEQVAEHEVKLARLEAQVDDLILQNRILVEERQLLLTRSEALRKEFAQFLAESVEPAAQDANAAQLALLEQQLRVLALRRTELERRRNSLIALMTKLAPNSDTGADLYAPLNPFEAPENQFEVTPLPVESE